MGVAGPLRRRVRASPRLDASRRQQQSATGQWRVRYVRRTASAAGFERAGKRRLVDARRNGPAGGVVEEQGLENDVGGAGHGCGDRDEDRGRRICGTW